MTTTYARRTPATARPATDKQVALITRLLDEKALPSSVTESLVVEDLDSRQASALIDYLFTAPRKVVDQVPGRQPAPVGYYLRNDRVYRVVLAKTTGNLYAKVLVLPEERGHGVQATWDYAPGIHRDLRADEVLTAQEASRLGHLHGYCVFCGKGLTDVQSEAAGYGKTCAGREGLPYPTRKEALVIVASREATRGTRD